MTARTCKTCHQIIPPPEPYTLADIIRLAGGASVIAERFGEMSRTTVWQWEKGKTPGIRDHYWPVLQNLAQEVSDVTLTAHDFFEANKMARSQAVSS